MPSSASFETARTQLIGKLPARLVLTEKKQFQSGGIPKNIRISFSRLDFSAVKAWPLLPKWITESYYAYGHQFFAET